jgi:hypothetical protein
VKNPVSKITIVLLLIICGWYGRNLDSWGRNKVINHDVISYYAYLPAAIIFQDFNFRFIKDVTPDYEVRVWYSTAKNGKPVLRMTMGLAILWLPFFLPAHALAQILGESALGYSWPYGLAIFIAALFYLGMGLLFLRKILLRHFTDRITAGTLAIVVVGTNLMHYVIYEPGMSHVYSFALIAAFLYVTLSWIRKPSVGNSFFLGLLAGLIILIRPINGLVLIFPAFIGITSLPQFRERITGNLKYILIAAGAAFLMLLPQILYWKIQTGHYLFNSYMESGRFYLLNPHIIDGLFSFRKGWLVYTPVMVVALAGFPLLRKHAGELRTPISVFMIVFIYLIFSWWCWWYGGSFGSRPMIETYGILSVPLAAALTWLYRRQLWIKITTGILLAAFISLNQFQMVQYRTSVLHWDGMTRSAYKSVFLKKIAPDNYEKLIQKPDYENALIGRPENR